MAFEPRTIDEIYQELLLEKQNLTALNGLLPQGITDENSLVAALGSSKVAEWLLWLYNMAVEVHITELRTLTAVEDIDEIFETKEVATERWYIERALEFQLDDTLIIDPITYQITYATLDTIAQIIASCTTKTFANKLFLKVRRKDTDLLTAPEKVQFETYMNQVKIAGTDVTVENFEGDLFTLNMTIIYDGTVDINDVETLVEDTINNYIVNLDFDSKFVTSAMIDALQALDEIIDPRYDSGSALDSLGVTVVFTHEYLTNAGWGQINPATPLSSTIAYVPRNK